MLSTPASTLLDDVSCTFLSMSGDVMLAETQYIFAMAVSVPDVLAALCLQRGLSHDMQSHPKYPFIPLAESAWSMRVGLLPVLSKVMSSSLVQQWNYLLHLPAVPRLQS